MQEMKLSALVLDFDLYPRPAIDSEHVKGMVDAAKAGTEFPPILVDKKSKRVVDGFHRYRVQQRIHGVDATIMATLKSYKTEADMVVDIVELNATHGKKLSPYDHARCILIAKRVGLSDTRLAGALHVPVVKLGELRTRKIASTNGEELAVKQTISHMAGKTLTRSQAEANKKLGGMKPLYYVNQLITLITEDLIDERDERLADSLKELGKLIKGM